ncbi:MAG: hypothetical protein MI862_18090 [Desulfobacterales bacterium]|nr:hypothetical protein [Desulfobacterales bacterium]
MLNTLELTDSYRKTRKWVMLISWLGIFWASSALNITKISLPNLKDITIADKSIPIVFLILLIFSVIKMHNEYAMMSIRIRRNSLAIFDFRLFLYLSKLAIASLAVSVEVRSIKQIAIFIGSFAPIAIIIVITGTVIGFIVVAIGSRLRKKKRGFAFWVISMFGLSGVLAKLMIILSIIGVAFGLTFSEFIRGYFGIYPTILGIWVMAIVAILLIAQQHFESIYSNALFGFEVYNPETNTKRYYDKRGRLIQIIENYKPQVSESSVLHLKKTYETKTFSKANSVDPKSNRNDQ